MNINWRVRLRNRTWLAAMAALLVSFVYSLLELLVVTPPLAEARTMELCQTVLTLRGLLGVVVDPTTAGVGDSRLAMTYTEPWADEPKGSIPPDGLD